MKTITLNTHCQIILLSKHIVNCVVKYKFLLHSGSYYLRGFVVNKNKLIAHLCNFKLFEL